MYVRAIQLEFGVLVFVEGDSLDSCHFMVHKSVDHEKMWSICELYMLYLGEMTVKQRTKQLDR